MTTITTAKLREIAHALGTELADVTIFATAHGVIIDDTPADTEEHDMDKMTITQEQFEAAIAAVPPISGPGEPIARRVFEAAGFTITPAEPPAEMVKLAREAYREADTVWRYPHEAWQGGYTSALQHAVGAVKEAEHEHAGHLAGLREAAIVSRVTRAILTALGAA